MDEAQQLQVAPSTPDVGALMKMALESESPQRVEMLERLVALHERVTDRQAVIEFNQAFARFQETCPKITKTSTASVATRAGGRYEYTYAELSHIADLVDPHLQANGFSYTWDSKLDGKFLTAVFRLRHAAGYSTESSFAVPFDASSPGMNSQQAHGAALTYARRQSLVAGLGLTTCDTDTDAASAETIGDDGIAEIEALLGDLGKAGDREKFLKYMKVGAVHEVRVSDLGIAVKALKETIANRAKGGAP